ncbi:Inactive cytochrome P450 [Arachis hypogaea]|nr:Inactive cytochrome P450 [Arachis hypogaea]
MAKLLCNLEKLQLKEELEHDLGKDEPQIEESHISNLPFLGAVVKETFRFHTYTNLITSATQVTRGC